MNMLKGLLKGDEPTMTNQNGQPPEPPLTARDLRPRYLSDAAAKAAQHVEDLEIKLDDATERLMKAHAHNVVLEERITMLTRDNDFLIKDRDQHRDRYKRIMHAWDDGVAHLIKVMAEPGPELEEPKPEAVNEFAPTPKNGKRGKHPLPNDLLEGMEQSLKNVPEEKT